MLDESEIMKNSGSWVYKLLQISFTVKNKTKWKVHKSSKNTDSKRSENLTTVR